MKRKVSDASGVPTHIPQAGIGGGLNENQIVVYQPNDTMHLDVRLENETVWLTQEQMALLFGRDQSVIARHVGNIFKEGELSRDSVYAKNAYTASDGKTYQVAFYNLDVVISVGYRVKSVQGTHFRQWATGVLREYLLRGYSVNSRLNQLEDKMDRRLAKHDDDIAELKNKVDFFVQTQTPPLQGVFYNGQLWDARVFVERLIGSAKRSLLLIDNWATVESLDLFAKKRAGMSGAGGELQAQRARGPLRPEFGADGYARGSQPGSY